jgi:predicted AAA+ superfamily ATPase
MPEIYASEVAPEQFYRENYARFVERDIYQLINLKDSCDFELFIRILAGRIGQLLNLNSISRDLGLSVSTLTQWLALLENSHLVFRLPCQVQNIGNRPVKASKLYFSEVGLASYLLGIKDVNQVIRDPLLGGLFENMVVTEALKTVYNSAEQVGELSFFRDSKGFEVDLLLDNKRKLLPMTIRAARSYNLDFVAAVNRFRAMTPNAGGGKVIYAGDLTPTIQDVEFVNFADVAKIITDNSSRSL